MIFFHNFSLSREILINSSDEPSPEGVRRWKGAQMKEERMKSLRWANSIAMESRILRTVGILPGHPTGKPPSKQKGALRMTCSNRMALAISHDASLFPFLLPLFSGCSFSSGAPATGVDSARYSSSSFNFSLSFAKWTKCEPTKWTYEMSEMNEMKPRNVRTRTELMSKIDVQHTTATTIATTEDSTIDAEKRLIKHVRTRFYRQKDKATGSMTLV